MFKDLGVTTMIKFDEIANMDAADAGDLKAMHDQWQQGTVSADEFFDGYDAGVDSIASHKLIAQYAALTLGAQACRKAGNIPAAQTLEDHCQLLYEKLADGLQW